MKEPSASSSPLAKVLLSHAPEELTRPGMDIDLLESTLQAILVRCQGAWPALGIAAAEFLPHLSQRLSGSSLPAALASIHAEDLYLACACMKGVPAALSAFEERLLSQVPRFVSRLHLGPAQLDDLCQTLRQKLLVPSGGAPPRIARYSGHGALSAWLRIAAMRAALNLRRNMDENLALQREPDAARLLVPGEDPELDFLRRRYEGEFQAAVQDAVRTLPAAQRDILRLNVVDGLSIDKLAELLHTSRATAARQLAVARGAVLEQTRSILQARLRLPRAEAQSLLRMMRSNIHLSIPRWLREDKGDGEQ